MEPLDPSGWSFYCNHCEAQRDSRLLKERKVSTGEEYFELVCNVCGSILLSMERRDLAKRRKPTDTEDTNEPDHRQAREKDVEIILARSFTTALFYRPVFSACPGAAPVEIESTSLNPILEAPMAASPLPRPPGRYRPQY